MTITGLETRFETGTESEDLISKTSITLGKDSSHITSVEPTRLHPLVPRKPPPLIAVYL